MVSIPSIINMGYTAADILGIISSKNRHVASKIRKGLSLGYSASTILSYLDGGKENDSEYVTEAERTARGDKKQTRKALATIGGTALGALGLAGGLASLGGRAGAIAASAAAQGNPSNPSPTQSQAQTAQPQATLPPIVQNAPTQAQAQTAQAQANQTIGAKATPIATNQSPAQVSPTETEFDYYKTKTHKSFGDRLTRFIEKHRDAGMSPKETEELVKKSNFTKGPASFFEKETGKPISEAISQVYSNKKSAVSKQKPSKSNGKKDLLNNISVLKKQISDLSGGQIK